MVDEKTWRLKMRKRIPAALPASGRMFLRDLQRACHYNRGPIPAFFDALADLEKVRQIAFELEDGKPVRLDDTIGGRIWVRKVVTTRAELSPNR